mgnify:CR=1 FL=1
MNTIKYLKDMTISDKRFFPTIGEEYKVIEVHNGMPIITNGRQSVMLHVGEFEIIN